MCCRKWRGGVSKLLAGVISAEFWQQNRFCEAFHTKSVTKAAQVATKLFVFRRVTKAVIIVTN